MTTPNLLLVGCGKMGGAMLTRWLERRFSDQIVVIEPSEAAAEPFRGRPGVHVTDDPDRISGVLRPDAVIFAVKPQAMGDVVPAYRRYSKLGGPVFLSIAAGTPISFFERSLGGNPPVVRAMPNTPAAVGRGVAALVANRSVDPNQMALCQTLLAAVGEVVWLGDEGAMDAVTAVSGSGPAYVFHLIETLAAAGVRAGLPDDLAMRLARGTVAGAGELVHLSEEDAATLRRNVTSPGGTTAAALEVLMADDGMAALMARAVEAAARRSKELADG